MKIDASCGNRTDDEICSHIHTQSSAYFMVLSVGNSKEACSNVEEFIITECGHIFLSFLVRNQRIEVMCRFYDRQKIYADTRED